MARILETLRDIAIAIGIAISIPWLVYWGVKSFVEVPKWPTDYYDLSLDREIDAARKELEVDPNNAQLKEKIAGIEQRIEQSHEDSRKKYDEVHPRAHRIMFYSKFIVGVLALIAGALTPILSISVGLVIGGIACLIGVYIHIWHTISPLMYFVSLLLALVFLIGIAFIISRRKRN